MPYTKKCSNKNTFFVLIEYSKYILFVYNLCNIRLLFLQETYAIWFLFDCVDCYSVWYTFAIFVEKARRFTGDYCSFAVALRWIFWWLFKQMLCSVNLWLAWVFFKTSANHLFCYPYLLCFACITIIKSATRFSASYIH